MSTIQVERRGRIALLTMAGDDDLNLAVVDDELHARLLEYGQDDGAWCAVVTGSGDRAFSAGADLKGIVREGTFGGDFWATRTLDLLSGAEFWKPIVAAVNGHALGAGLMLALGCDIRVASANATFGLPEVKYGFPPGMGATLRLPRAIPLGPALEMLLTGDRISAQQALHWGLVNRVVPQAQLMDAAFEIAQRIASNPPLAVRATKELALRGLDLTLEQGLRMESMLSHIARQTEDAREGPRAFVDKRPPTFSGR